MPEILGPGTVLIADYTFEKDALFARINLAGDELEMYHRVHEALAEKIPLPDLVVYLRASTDVLMRRITLRDRPYERDMDRGYIDALNGAYSYFFHHYQASPLLVVNTNDLDFVNVPRDFDLFLEQLQEPFTGTRFFAGETTGD